MGYDPSCDYRGNNLAPLVDKVIGQAFWVVKGVYDQLTNLHTIITNLPSLLQVAAQVSNFMETLTVSDVNTVSALSHTYAGKYALVVVNGVAYTNTGPTPAFTITGTTLTWSAANSGVTLTPGVSNVSIFYSCVAF